MNLKKFIPMLSWLPGYGSNQLKGDLSAGLTVGVMLIPQGMAYALIAGLPPIYGLYASIFPLILYAIFGTSRQLAVGPVAMMSLLVAEGVGELAHGDMDMYIMYAITLALMVGVIQFSLGVFRLGFLVNFLSHPVISGFTSAAALIIGFNQIKNLMGVSLPRSNYIHEILISAVQNIGDTSIPTLLIALGGMALIIGGKKINKAIPGPLIAVVFGVLVVWLTGIHESGVKIVGEVPKGLPAPIVPSLSGLQELLPIAITISLVGFMESIAVAKAIQSKHKDYKIDPNQELIGLGVANIGGSFFQSFPTTGGFSRTAVNDQAGAKTGMASIISAVLIGLTLLFLTPLFYYLPKAILASVILVAVVGLIDVKEPIHLWKVKRDDFFMLIVTFLATLSLGIEMGILTGVALSLGMVIYRTTKPHIARLGNIPGTVFYRNVERFKEEVVEREDTLILRFDAQLYFANTNHFSNTLEEMMEEKGEALKYIILDASSINTLDSSAMHVLHDLAKDLKKKGIQLFMIGVKGPVRDLMFKAHLMEEIGEERFYLRIQDAIDVIDGNSEFDNYPFERHAVQTNT